MLSRYQALLSLPQFVCWKLEPRHGKPTKVPCDPRGRPVDVTNPANHMTYEQACRHSVTGVGFVLTEKDPFFLLDIDKCLLSTGQWSDVANTLLSLAPGALVETSVSGQGLHVIGSTRAALPPHSNKNTQLGLEFYHKDRFVALGDMQTATGDAATNCDQPLATILPTFFPPRAVATLDDWTDGPVDGWTGPTDDDELIALASRSLPVASAFTDRATFADLWEQNVDALAAAYPSQSGNDDYDGSSADMALASRLAFYTGHDCERIVRLMWESGLVREKWQREDYMRGTVLRATADREQFYGSNRVAVDTDQLEQVRQLIEEQSGNAFAVPVLVDKIAEIADPLGRESAVAYLKAAMRADKVYTGAMGKEIDTRLADLTRRTVGSVPDEGGYLDSDTPMNPSLWTNAKGKDRKPRPTLQNYRVMLKCYGVRVVFDEVCKELSIAYPGQSDSVIRDEAAIGHIASLCGLNEFPSNAASLMLPSIAADASVNPVEQWLAERPWDGVDRFDELMSQITLDPEEDPVTAYMLFRKWFRGAVAIGTGRAKKMEYVLTLVDPAGGAGKTRFFATLAPSGLLKDSLTLDPSDKDSVKIATSCWLAELGELDSTFRRSDQGKLKAFLSHTTDELRLPYAKAYVKYPRRTAFFGSVNSTMFLNDDSDNRRYWPVRVQKLNHQHTVDMQQLWAQIEHEVVSGQQWHLTDDEAASIVIHNQEFKSISRVVDALSGLLAEQGERNSHMSATEVLSMCGYHQARNGELQEAGHWLKRNGFRKSKVNGKVGYYVPRTDAAAFQPTIIQGAKQ